LESIEEDEEFSLEDDEDEVCSLEEDGDDDDDEGRGRGDPHKSSVRSIHCVLPFFTSPSLFKLLRILISFEDKVSRGFFSFFTSSFTLDFNFNFTSGLLSFLADDEDPSNIISISIT
jgi:hypothetical protein